MLRTAWPDKGSALQKKMQEIRSDSSLSREQRREKMQPLMEEQTKKMKEILTPERFKKWQEMPRPGRPGAEKKDEGKKTEKE